MTDHPATSHPPAAWAEVCVGDRVTRYRRSGAGRVIVLLAAADDGVLAAALAERHRLLVPEPPGPGDDVARWLLDFLEGLGVARAVVVAAGAYARPALEQALRDADAVSGVVLVEAAADARDVLARCDATAR